MNLDPQDIAKSVAFNRKRSKTMPSYTVPLPGWECEWLHIGALVASNVNTTTAYTVVQFVDDDFAVIVPLSRPVCAYTVPTADLRKITLAEAAEIYANDERE